MTDDILRPVSVLEEYARTFGIVVSRNRIQGKLSIAHLRRALHVMMKRHPFLNATLDDSHGECAFKKNQGLAIPLIVKEDAPSEEERNRLYEEELNRPLNYYEQLWRVLVILDGKEDDIGATSRTDVILTVQHVICDGLSILNLAKEILEQTQALQQGKLLYENQPLPAMPPLDAYLHGMIHRHASSKKTHPLHATTHQAAEAAENDLALDVLDRDISIPKNQCRVRYVEGQYSKKDMRSLYSHCRRAHTSVHGAVAACMLKAIGECITTPEGRPRNLLSRNPVNLRTKAVPDRGGIGDEHMLNFVISELVLCSFDEKTSIPELSQQYTAHLNHKIKTQQALKRYEAVAETKRFTEINRDREGQILLFSNVGQIATRSDYDDFKLLATDYVPSKKTFALQFALTSFAGQLHYVLLYTFPWYQTTLIEDVHRRFREHLSTLL